MNGPPKDLALIHMPQSVAKWWVMVGIGLGTLDRNSHRLKGIARLAE
jgi:hypothetical protein